MCKGQLRNVDTFNLFTAFCRVQHEVQGFSDNNTSSVSSSESSKTPAPESEGRQEVEDEVLNAMYLGKEYNNGNSCDTLAANRRLGESDMLGTESNEVRGSMPILNWEEIISLVVRRIKRDFLKLMLLTMGR
ncbi:hypothetical protein V6N11_035619 [Hibiscus sabdariffa]|uniref:Uncharacterized protein n=1 Tax=Hibiscus sabdariffa TaxID=183260 RepID=A0ABR2N715_9ROSI